MYSRIEEAYYPRIHVFSGQGHKQMGKLIFNQFAEIAGVQDMLTEGYLQDNADFLELIQQQDYSTHKLFLC